MRFSSLVFFGATALAAKEPPPKPTKFNGVTVPVPLELTPENFDKEIGASKYLLIKHYSPYCPHCLDYAPTYQTAYEFYYTSQPEGTDKDFTSFYDFRFATMNCIAYYDLCKKTQVQTYPTTALYVDGKFKDSLRGGKNMTLLSEFIEGALEAAKPGSRPKTLDLPEPGDRKSPGFSGGSGSSKKKAASPSKTDAPAKAASKAPEKPKAQPNRDGKSVSLTAETFQDLVTLTDEPWFIKFYAPWCHHCQQLAPVWQQLAATMRGNLNVGEVNCEAEKRLCKGAGLRGYPTIMFFKGGERIEYNGLRGLGDLKLYAEKALDLSSGVPDVDAESLKAIEEKEDVVFIYFYDHATTSEDFAALERLPLNLIGRAKLVKTKDEALFKRYKITTWPRLIVSREGRPTYYTPLTPNEMRDVNGVLNWMRSVWLPLVAELTATNAREIMDGKLVVLGVLNRDDAEGFQSAQREMKSAANEWMDKQVQLFQLERKELRDAKQLRIEEAEDRGDQRALRAAKNMRINMDKSAHKEVTFAWVDGVFWQRWIRVTYGIDVKDGERVIINDEDNRRYWDQTSTGNYIIPSRTSILETLSKVTASPPKIKPKLTIGSVEKIFFDVKVAFAEHPYLTVLSLGAVALVVASYLRGRYRRSRGYFRLDDHSHASNGGGGATGSKVVSGGVGHRARGSHAHSVSMAAKESFLGGGTNGKVD